ncbi:MAG TPA: NAD-dependent epimerase/dehydratase family protein [Myxococcales bacterium]|jgi:UDP-glucuronate 4-epimerase|nr:NAD-dependent epimerase/dehydratase family protein [Myxococcales bacterium]
MRILVTGGAGFIGSHLCAALLARRDEVTCVDNFDPFYPERLKRRAIAPLLASGMRLVESDVRDAAAMLRAAQEAKPDAVVHLAARAGVRPSLADPGGYVDTNTRGTAHLLEAARQAGVRRFLLGSSSSVYGASAVPPFRESARVDSPESPYAASKAAAELLARTFHNLYGLEVVCLRFFTVYGPRQRPDLAIHKFARRMLAGQSLPFYGDGSSARDYTFVDDIVQGVLAALDVPLAYDVINLGGARMTTLAELIALLEQVLSVPAVLERLPMQPGDVPLTSADVSHAASVLGYAPRTPIAEGLRIFAAWLRGEGRDWT